VAIPGKANTTRISLETYSEKQYWRELLCPCLPGLERGRVVTGYPEWYGSREFIEILISSNMGIDEATTTQSRTKREYDYQRNLYKIMRGKLDNYDCGRKTWRWCSCRVKRQSQQANVLWRLMRRTSAGMWSSTFTTCSDSWRKRRHTLLFNRFCRESVPY